MLSNFMMYRPYRACKGPNYPMLMYLALGYIVIVGISIRQLRTWSPMVSPKQPKYRFGHSLFQDCRFSLVL